jgi:hypothetical protein
MTHIGLHHVWTGFQIVQRRRDPPDGL